ncbi:tRNA(Ile)-lysidine synthase [Thermoactinomyces sp. DSM 45891]|uniref:tRNA lysidine(34) synthetase TilS n=1 Tax=Thermoactinomyces sp. DSM 45891 TaxID=1761907 RepID=UPI000919F6A4|nr:tRNA lysidine(34) synthetase TilS [Thermoactinomyces sp. DSM 45891]SFX39745.1 tRNA(Ile)-lysidine synthase [Thermoactinomyces sp. DSM 45891]
MLREVVDRVMQQELRIPEHASILVAVSGGPDSIALLHILKDLSKEYKWKIGVIHVNHQLRGEESLFDEQYVKEICSQLGVPCWIERVDVRRAVRQEGGNKQDIARTLRYEAFAKVAKRESFGYVALGHHQDDQAETILMRLIRGTHSTGLIGIPIRREWENLELIRPFLSSSREMIVTYCKHHHLMPRTDQSNLSKEYTRNFLRLEIFPELEKMNPKVKETISQLGARMLEEEEVWKEWEDKALEEISLSQDHRQVSWSRKRFLDLSIALQRRVVKLILSSLEWLTDVEITYSRIEQIRHWISSPGPSGEIHLEKGIVVRKSYEIVTILKQSSKDEVTTLTWEELKLNIPGKTEYHPSLGAIEACLFDQPQSEEWFCSSPSVVFDYEQVPTSSFLARPRKAGDRMSCFGLQGTKKVKDLMIEKQIPRHLRDLIPVVHIDDQVLWIPGVRRSAIAPVTNQTSYYLYLRWHSYKMLE